jgi:CRISPR system Cascade subunit CasA
MKMDDAREHPVARLVLEAASGNNATLFNHAVVEGDQEVPAGRAACYVLAHQAFAIGFGKSKPFYLRDGPLTRGMSFLALGDDLFETLVLNLMSKVRWTTLGDTGEDRPFWEPDALPQPDAAGTWPSGRSDYLTWLSRRIHLIAADGSLNVARCQIQQNLCLPSEMLAWDPYKRYRKDEMGWTPIGLAPDKAAWRDCHALLNLKLTDEAPPQLLHWLGTFRTLCEDGVIRARTQCQLVVFGLSTAPGKAASVEMWRQERLPLPLAYLGMDSDELIDRLKACLEVAESVGSALRRATWFVAKQLLTGPGDQRGGPDVQKLAGHLSLDELYWPRLEEPFRRLVETLPQGGGWEAWRNELERTARRAFGTVWSEFEGSGRGLRSLVAGEAFFGRELIQALKPLRKEGEE